MSGDGMTNESSVGMGGEESENVWGKMGVEIKSPGTDGDKEIFCPMHISTRHQLKMQDY